MPAFSTVYPGKIPLGRKRREKNNNNNNNKNSAVKL